MIFDPARFRRKAATAAKWAALVAMAAVPRLAMMATVERRLDADESIVGLMAKHIAAGEGVPFFFYGQHYGGGHVIEALFAAPLFKAFGPSEWAIHLSPVLFSVGIVLLVYIYMQKVYGGKAGLLAAALTAFSTPFLKSSLKADGYVETIFLGMAALMVARLIEEAYRAGAGRRRMMLCAALGVILGLAWWSYDFALIYAIALIPVALRFGMLSVPGAVVFA
ncbi:MAG TPA: glycosyltransferase family 39 protein, partial [bacterium]|nr:glycosyltransferase family 39 protein [bacterium]